jgi:hypothetical protein
MRPAGERGKMALARKSNVVKRSTNPAGHTQPGRQQPGDFARNAILRRRSEPGIVQRR